MSTLNTFLVEDSAVIRDDLVAALEELAPVEVVAVAEDENSAVEWLLHNQCDLVVIDMFLKSGSGVGVLRRARQLDKKMTLVVLSNYAIPTLRSTCLRLGAAKVFDKSTELDDLIEYCARLADRPSSVG